MSAVNRGAADVGRIRVWTSAMLGVALGATGCADQMVGPNSEQVNRNQSVAASYTAGAEMGGRIPDQYVVTFTADVRDVPGLAKQLVAQAGGRELYTYTAALSGFSARMTQEQAAGLRSNPRVKDIVQDVVVHTAATQTNPPWGLDRIDQRQLPLSSTFTADATGSGVTVYILDTGIRYSHSEFGGRASLATDVIGGDGSDCHGHGTHVAGTTGGATYGVAKSVTLKSVRVLNCDGSAPMSAVLAGMDWVAANAVRPAVANMSLGGSRVSVMDEAVARMTGTGIVVVAAAGNSNQDACAFSPAAAPSALTVGATSNSDARATFSNKGPCVDLFAPGVGITSAIHTGDNAAQSWNGTSMAAPHVAGVAALLLSEQPSLSTSQVDSAIHARSTKLVVADAQSLNSHLVYAGRDDDDTEIPPVQPIGAPSGVAVSVVGEYLTDPVTPALRVSWSDNSTTEAGFEVWDDSRLLWRSQPNAVAWQTFGYPYGSTVTFRVRAVGFDGGLSDFAATTVTLPPQPLLPQPAAPSEFLAAIQQAGYPYPDWSQVKLSWRDNADNEAGFDIWGTNHTTTRTLRAGVLANVTAAFVPLEQGRWTLEIRARNSGGVSSWVSLPFCVTGPTHDCDPAPEPPPPEPISPPPPAGADPIASFTVNCRANRNRCAFDASGSQSPATFTNYAWQFGDGTSESGAARSTTTHTYGSKGDYMVTLTVTDSNGRSGSTQRTVSVKSIGK